ncbi:MAG: DNA repair protein RadC [Oscillospiraceae bacterium]|jgi:DNA repair protein RadC|nr:DNA repair protein RadC [Oscillospiraceae bacterium]
MHEDHRQRVRERFLSAGLASFPPHNVLELLLFYSIPRRDTNEIAHRLLDRFGSLTGVLEAPFEELCKVEGIGEHSAALIVLIFQIAKRYLSEQGAEKISFDSTEQFRRFVISNFIGLKNETAYLFCLNNTGQLIHTCAVSLGTKHTVSLDNRTLLETAFLHNATKVVLAHNHPSGLATPSSNDVARTESAVQLFRQVNIQMLDHLVVANGDCFSMANHPKFARIFFSNLVCLPDQIAADSTWEKHGSF